MFLFYRCYEDELTTRETLSSTIKQ